MSNEASTSRKTIAPSLDPDTSDETATATCEMSKPAHGIHALAVTHSPLKSYLAKTQAIFDFEQEGTCGVCSDPLEHGQGLFAVCPHPDCNTVSHLDCLSKHFLESDSGADNVIPVRGTCPGCNQHVRWVEVIKEVSLRTRGQKEVERLLKPSRAKTRAGKDVTTEKEKSLASKGRPPAAKRRKGQEKLDGKSACDTENLIAGSAVTTLAVAAYAQSDEDSELSDLDYILEGELGDITDNESEDGNEEMDPAIHATDVSDDTDGMGQHSPAASGKNKGKGMGTEMRIDMGTDMVIEDSDWDDAEMID